MKTAIFLLCLFKITLSQAPLHLDYFIIRNVGQGQWVTRVQNNSCTHYDFGGESRFYSKLKAKFILQCSRKLNILNLSHADWDHYSFIELIQNSSVKICWGTQATDDLRGAALNIPFCSALPSNVLFYHSQGRDKNDRSTIQLLQGWLIPGDSSQKMEKIWSKNITTKKVKYLILGHHGSKTSTSALLLKRIPQTKLAIASARYNKFRHPSPETVLNVKRFHIPLIKTEDWGDIVIE